MADAVSQAQAEQLIAPRQGSAFRDGIEVHVIDSSEQHSVAAALSTLRAERDAARAEVDRLGRENERMREANIQMNITLQHIADAYRNVIHCTTLDRITAAGIRPMWMSDPDWENRVRCKHFGAHP